MIGFDTGGNVIGGPGHIEGGMDWGLGPEGSEGVRVGHSERKAGEDRDVSPLEQKQSFMASNPLGQPFNIFATKSPTQPVGNISYYLDDETSEKISSLHSKPGPVSSWARPYEKVSNQEALRRVLEAHTTTTHTPWDNPNTPTSRPLSRWANSYAPSTTQTQTQEMNPLMVAGLKYGLPEDEILKVRTTSDPRILGSYNLWSDEMKINPSPSHGKPTDYTGTPFHEVAHRLIGQLEWDDYNNDVRRADFLNQQMPDVQALYETGGSQLSPGYGTQGEMVTSRAATVEDLLNLNAPIHSGSYKAGEPWGSTDWRAFAEEMKKDPVNTYDWMDSPKYNPNENLTNLEELGYDKELARQYENYVRFNQELPSKYQGGDPLNPINKTYNLDETSKWRTGLEGWPLGSDHFLVDRLMARNPNLSKGHREGLERALLNELNAAKASPNSMLNKISKLGLADQFWDYVEEYLSEESEDWSPSRAKEEIQKLLGG